MKKSILILILLLSFLAAKSQRYTMSVDVQSLSTDFTRTLPVNTQVTVLDSSVTYILTAVQTSGTDMNDVITAGEYKIKYSNTYFDKNDVNTTPVYSQNETDSVAIAKADSLDNLLSVSGTTDSIRVLSSVPENGNAYIDSASGIFWWKSNTKSYWYAAAKADSISTVTNTLADNIVGYWKMEEASGQPLYDEVANEMLIIDDASTQTITGKVGSAIDFNGVAQRAYAASGAQSYFQPGTSDFSITMYVYIDAGVGTTRGIFAQDGTGNFSILATSDNRIRLRTAISGSNVDTYSNSTTSVDTWYHITITFDRDGYANLWINGQKQTAQEDISAYTATSIGTGLTYVSFAAFGTSIYTDMILDEVKVWHRTLTADEVSEDYQNFTNGVPLTLP